MRALILTIALLAGAASQATVPKVWHVGIGPAATVRAATAPGGTVTITRGPITLNPDGSQQVTLIYSNAGGAQIHIRTLYVDGACSKVTDSLGGLVSAAGPAGECSAATSFTGTLDTTIGNAASGGKLNL